MVLVRVRTMKKLGLDEVLGKHLSENYEEQYRYILNLVEEGKIRPVKSSPKNGKKPALHTMYWLVEDRPDYTALTEELLYRTDARISVDYYLKHPDIYERERRYVRRLHEFLQHKRESLRVPISCNERSFAIWGEEKYLQSGPGRTLLGRCGLDTDFLNCYDTAEPFAYYAASRAIPQNILILENKDPFFSMRRWLMDGKTTILGEPVGTLVYGAGKRVVSCFREFDISAEPYMKAPGNRLLYFGDLDYEGIGIYEALVRNFPGPQRIEPFIPAYEAMLAKAGAAPPLPATKEKQNRNAGSEFFPCFAPETAAAMKRVLEQGLYIPQEILNCTDY